MDEIVKRVTDVAGIDADLARRAIEIILELVRDNGPEDKVQELFAKLPGVDMAPGEGSRGGGILGALGSLGGAMGAMGALNRLTEAGLSMREVQTVGREVVAYSREQAGDELVGEIVASIPGLSQFV
jgi:hypothetical protein